MQFEKALFCLYTVSFERLVDLNKSLVADEVGEILCADDDGLVIFLCPSLNDKTLQNKTYRFFEAFSAFLTACTLSVSGCP